MLEDLDRIHNTEPIIDPRSVMFSRRGGSQGLDRFEYLQTLVTEFQDTDSLDMLTEDRESFVEFGIGGLCNLSLDKINKEYILQNNGVKLVIGCLSSPSEETVLSAITTLMYLMTPASRQEITHTAVVECMLRFSLSANRRLSNLASVFLQDYCSVEQVEKAQSLQGQSALGIPLPKD
ncbi:armadillo repeat-containing protein 7 isoform X2 [Amia ocellicauda]|uniref:armadillo repeat-containing protein 7 isoform X2 n=1 Tax=Amia ocellicauda TaxID=2972642 RepID=UPI0034643546